MTEQPGAAGRDLPPEFIELIRTWFGPNADEVIEAFRQSGVDLNSLFEASGMDAAGVDFGGVISELNRLMRTGSPDGSINWDLAYDAARKVSLSKGADPVIASRSAGLVVEAFKVADLWLDQATDFTPAGSDAVALSAADWIEATLPRWRQLTTPVANSLTKAMTWLMKQHAEEHPGVADVAQGAQRMLLPMIGSLFGLQLGQALGQLSREVFGYTDTGLPLVEPGATAMLPEVASTFAKDLQLPESEVRLFLATRESAHARLFKRVPWLVDHLYGAVESYASEITIDLGRLETMLADINPRDPSSIREAISSGLVAPLLTERQRSALRRLETALALVEGWVDVVSQSALHQNLPDLNSLREMARRRRAEGGPAEHTLATLVGLELRPRRARQASALWQSVTDRVGPAEREALWSHPDLLPSSDDLDQPEEFWDRRQARGQADAALDAEIAAFLDAPDSPGSAEPPTTPESPGSLDSQP
ncbi:MAG: zinc-dependent metalloprotease [Bifidobacteriaceae bacterium]|jgi:putative hydrolase|nr:zinc-dependent metalloprotease [Bifidobacteriaceae bacterium]